MLTCAMGMKFDTTVVFNGQILEHWPALQPSDHLTIHRQNVQCHRTNPLKACNCKLLYHTKSGEIQEMSETSHHDTSSSTNFLTYKAPLDTWNYLFMIVPKVYLTRSHNFCHTYTKHTPKSVAHLGLLCYNVVLSQYFCNFLPIGMIGKVFPQL